MRKLPMRRLESRRLCQLRDMICATCWRLKSGCQISSAVSTSSRSVSRFLTMSKCSSQRPFLSRIESPLFDRACFAAEEDLPSARQSTEPRFKKNLGSFFLARFSSPRRHRGGRRRPCRNRLGHALCRHHGRQCRCASARRDDRFRGKFFVSRRCCHGGRDRSHDNRRRARHRTGLCLAVDHFAAHADDRSVSVRDRRVGRRVGYQFLCCSADRQPGLCFAGAYSVSLASKLLFGFAAAGVFRVSAVPSTTMQPARIGRRV